MTTVSISEAAMQRPVTHKITFRRKLTFTLVCILAFLLCCEAAVRARAWIRFGSTGRSVGGDDSSMVDPETGLFIPRPGYEISGQRHSIRINSLGFRGDEF